MASKPFWLGVAVGFLAAVLLLVVMIVGLLGLASGGGGRLGQSIDHEPISLEQTHQLIDSRAVDKFEILDRQDNGDELCYFILNEGGDFCRRKVDGENVHLFNESMPTGVPILSDDEDKVGLTSEQLNELLRRTEQYTATASSLIEVLDQRE